MKNFLLTILLIVSQNFICQDFSNKVSRIIKDEGISSKVSNVFLFTEKSPTINLNNYENIFITLDTSEVKYLKTDSNSDFKGEGIFNIYLSNTMIFTKDVARDLYCYKLNTYKYLVIRVDKDHKNEANLINKENICNCNEVYSISNLGKTMPQSTFYYYLVRGIPLLSNVGTFDALQFLQIEFLIW